jgi:quinol monooxygenase YgiN
MAGAVFFNIWQTKSKEKRQALLAAMRQEAPDLQAKPGFLSLTVWAGEGDDLRVIVRGEWASQAAFEAAVSKDPHALASREKLAALGTPTPGSFTETFRFQNS